MPLVNDQKLIYDFALKNKFIIPAFNFFDIESMRALFEAADEADSPVIAQISLPAYKNLAPIERFIPYFKSVAEKYRAPIMLNHDYLPSFEACKYAIDIGFPYVSFDGSRLPFEENVRATVQIVQYAHPRGIMVEAEIGNVAGVGFSPNSIYTEPKQAVEFVERTGCDALAVSAGTSHGGIKAEGPLQIQYTLLDEIKKAVGSTPLVLHGAASRPKAYTDKVNRFGGNVDDLCMATEESIEKTRHHGVVKIYADMDNWLSITGALRQYFSEHSGQFNPVQYMPLGGIAMKDAIMRKMTCVTKSVGWGNAFRKQNSDNGGYNHEN
jgi:fructose-bisphosphate aldolase class II